MPLLIPETAPVRAILLAWPFAASDWQDSLDAAEKCYWQILKCFISTQNRARVWLLLHPTIDASLWQERADAMGVDLKDVNIIHDVYYNDTWVRDYGPLSLSNGYCAFQFNGWGQKYDAEMDNGVAEKLIPYYKNAFKKIDFVAEGGALEINEQAVLLANLDCVVGDLRNPGQSVTDVEQVFKRELGVQEFIWLQNINLFGDDTDGHIDTIARFAENNGIVCCGRDAKHHDAEELEKLNLQLEKICAERSWALYPLPMPVIHSSVDQRLLPATYANFLVANGIVYVPVYGVYQDDAALQIMQKAFPSYQIVPIRCEALLEQHGSLHCATMQISVINS